METCLRTLILNTSAVHIIVGVLTFTHAFQAHGALNTLFEIRVVLVTRKSCVDPCNEKRMMRWFPELCPTKTLINNVDRSVMIFLH